MRQWLPSNVEKFELSECACDCALSMRRRAEMGDRRRRERGNEALRCDAGEALGRCLANVGRSEGRMFAEFGKRWAWGRGQVGGCIYGRRGAGLARAWGRCSVTGTARFCASAGKGQTHVHWGPVAAGRDGEGMNRSPAARAPRGEGGRDKNSDGEKKKGPRGRTSVGRRWPVTRQACVGDGDGRRRQTQERHARAGSAAGSRDGRLGATSAEGDKIWIWEDVNGASPVWRSRRDRRAGVGKGI